jgi:hypothetical protein
MDSMTARRVPSRWLRIITVGGVLASAVRLVHLARTANWGLDHRIFWGVGTDIWSGIDPYSADRFWTHPFLHPPTTFPFFALVAAVPFGASLVVWSLIYTVLAFGVVLLAKQIVDAQQAGEIQALSGPELGALATAVALSDASMATIQLGQLALLATTLILLAVWAQSRHRHVTAGVALGIATMKIGTMLPFLLLFHRRRDWKTWLALGATVVALILLGGQPGRLLDQLRAMLHYIGELSRHPNFNDISYAGVHGGWILGIDHLLYRLGIHDRSTLTLLQFGALLVMGLWLACELATRRIPPGLGLALVSLYSVIFLYHRLYDTVMIAPALVYAAGRAKATSGRPHFLSVMATILMFLVLYLRRRTLGNLTDWVLGHHGIAAMLTERFVLPYGTWSVLLAMGCLRLANGDSTDSPARPTPTGGQSQTR